MQKQAIEGFRLSPQQERLWSLGRSGESSAYRAHCLILIEGELDAPALAEAFGEVINRHEILRTTYQRLPGMDIPFQVIGGAADGLDERKDITHLKASEQEVFIEREIERASRHRFDYQRGPITNATLLKLSSLKRLLLIAMPALCADAKRLDVLMRELGRCYDARINNRELEDEPAQYADLAEVFQSLLESQETEAGREFWRNKDVSDIASLKLPFENNTPARAGFEPSSLSLPVDAEAAVKIKRLAQVYGVSLSDFMLTCWQVLLHRLSGKLAITVGVSSDGRTADELENALGLFSKYVPVECDFESDPKFSQALMRVNESAEEVNLKQEYFSWNLVKQPDSASKASCYFPASFDYIGEAQPFVAGGISFSIRRRHSCFDRFNVKLACTFRASSLVTEFHYDPAILGRDDVAQLAEQFHQLMNSAVDSPDERVSSLEVLNDNQKRQILFGFNDTKAEFNRDRLVHKLFQKRARRNPDNVAISVEGQQLSYCDLEARANQLANYLRGAGVGPDVLVAVCMDRSLELVIGLLAILKAGGAYLPLDPAYPRERLSFMLEDAGAVVLLAQQHTLDALPAHNAQAICLDSDWPVIASQSETAQTSDVMPDNLAYVIYTSGSSGRPKGVMISHRAICNRLLWMQDKFRLTESDSVAQKTPFSFDASVWEFFAPLLAGGRVVLARPGERQDSESLIKLIASQQITTLQVVPSMLKLLLEEEQLESCVSIKRVFCGGEALPLELVEKFHARLDADLHNLYGPTEASIDATHYECVRGEHKEGSKVARIGRPISNTRIYILDEQQKLAPLGVPAELCIAGEGLARGYLGRPALTAEKFIPNPFSEAGGRLYRSGDLARFLKDGTIEFLGRIDDQVKVRGFRIELGEIEAVLSQHPSVRASVVVAREDVPGDRRLVAYVVGDDEQTLRASELRSFVKMKLPEFMVPSVFMIVESLPLSPNGKLDRRALPAPNPAAFAGDGKFVASRNPVEEILASIWAELLGVEQIGIHDNFFELGGHSILMIQVISRLRQTLQVSLSLNDLFQSPTVAQMAEAVNKAKRAEQGYSVPPITRVSRDSKLPLSFAQQRLWFLYQLEPDSAAFNIPLPARLKGPLKVEALEQCLSEIIKRHETLRTTFATVEGRPVQIIAKPEPIKLSIEDISHLEESEREATARSLVSREARTPFDLTRGPMLRARLVRVAEDDHVVLFTLHHIVSDGWSSGIMFRELSALYEAFIEGKPSPLQELSIQYADFAAWQREWLTGEALERALSYWRKQLETAPALLGLPTDRPRPEARTQKGASHPFALSHCLTQSLKELSSREGVTLFMTLLAAFQLLLHRYSGQRDIVVGTDVANRNWAHTEEIIGFFINQLVMRGDLSDDPTFKQLLARVRETALEAYAHQELPFERLVEELKPDRSLGHAPLFQVKLVLQNIPSQPLELPGLTLTPLDFNKGTAQLDLIFSLEQGAQGLVGEMEYSTDLFDASTIARMLDHYSALLEQVIAEPRRPISQYRLLSKTETAGFTPDHFPDVELSVKEFENLMMELSKPPSGA